MEDFSEFLFVGRGALEIQDLLDFVGHRDRPSLMSVEREGWYGEEAVLEV